MGNMVVNHSKSRFYHVLEVFYPFLGTVMCPDPCWKNLVALGHTGPSWRVGSPGKPVSFDHFSLVDFSLVEKDWHLTKRVNNLTSKWGNTLVNGRVIILKGASLMEHLVYHQGFFFPTGSNTGRSWRMWGMLCGISVGTWSEFSMWLLDKNPRGQSSWPIYNHIYVCVCSISFSIVSIPHSWHLGIAFFTS